MSEGAVTFHVTGGEEFVPRLFAELGVPIQSVRVCRPTLDDVFMSYTGRTIRDAEAAGADGCVDSAAHAEEAVDHGDADHPGVRRDEAAVAGQSGAVGTPPARTCGPSGWSGSGS